MAEILQWRNLSRDRSTQCCPQQIICHVASYHMQGAWQSNIVLRGGSSLFSPWLCCRFAAKGDLGPWYHLCIVFPQTLHHCPAILFHLCHCLKSIILFLFSDKKITIPWAIMCPNDLCRWSPPYIFMLQHEGTWKIGHLLTVWMWNVQECMINCTLWLVGMLDNLMCELSWKK